MDASPARQDERLAEPAGADARRWGVWLFNFVLLAAIATALLYLAVVAIDPYSTGRFALRQSIDMASPNVRLSRSGLVRDPRFDAAIIGSSTSIALDPKDIGDATGWHMAQLAIYAALPDQQLVVARAFNRHHAAQTTLQIHGLDQFWCRVGSPGTGGWGPFPSWLYESSNAEYLSRLLFPDAVTTAARRVGIWFGMTRPALRPDGYATPDLRPSEDINAALPLYDADPPEAGFPALDDLFAHIRGLDPATRLVLMFTPTYVKGLPAAGSAADVRLRACKQLVEQFAERRPNTAYLDLMTDNEIARNPAYYMDPIHYYRPAAVLIEQRLIDLVRSKGLARP